MKKLLTIAVLSLLLLPVATFAQSSVSEEYKDVLGGVVDEIEQAVLDQDVDRLIGGMTDELAEDVGAVLETALADENEIVTFSIYGNEYLQVDDTHFRVDGKYSIKARGSNGTWSVNGLGVFIELVELEDSFMISDTNLHEVLTTIDFRGLISDYGSIILGVLALFLVTSIFWVWMLVDVIRRDIQDKAPWILLIVLANWLGSVIYFFTARKKYKIKK
ncbi:PLDc_N domain-containing protein [Candidatus Uhrbacteria bacterium]|jgi:hypothetical protein|nr:PLDc_N domain-containing protein [Candidatus Uhrbacteria bacterium]